MSWNDRWFKVWGYVDSGAAYSIFSSRVASQMGIDSAPESRAMVVVGDGGSIPVALYTLPVRIGEEEIQAQIGFSERLGVGFNLVGRKDIFDAFKICFEESQGLVTFERTNTS